MLQTFFVQGLHVLPTLVRLDISPYSSALHALLITVFFLYRYLVDPGEVGPIPIHIPTLVPISSSPLSFL